MLVLSKLNFVRRYRRGSSACRFAGSVWMAELAIGPADQVGIVIFSFEILEGSGSTRNIDSR